MYITILEEKVQNSITDIEVRQYSLTLVSMHLKTFITIQ